MKCTYYTFREFSRRFFGVTRAFHFLNEKVHRITTSIILYLSKTYTSIVLLLNRRELGFFQERGIV